MNVENFINPELYNLCVLLTKNGYNVYLPSGQRNHNKGIGYYYVEKDNKICYVGFSSLGGIDISTRHIPNIECGGGFSMKELRGTLNDINIALNCHTPSWGRCYKPKKYRNWKHYLEFNYYNDADFTLFEVNNEQSTN